MDNIELGIEISDDVVKSKRPDKIQRYDLVPPKKEVKKTKKDLPWYYWIGGKKDV